MSKTVKKSQPTDFHATILAKDVRRLRRLLPLCERLGTTIGADSAISALECYDERVRSARDATPRWGRAFNRVVDAHGLTASPALTLLDEAHGEDLCATSDEAFLTGYYAGLAAGRLGGAR